MGPKGPPDTKLSVPAPKGWQIKTSIKSFVRFLRWLGRTQGSSLGPKGPPDTILPVSLKKKMSFVRHYVFSN